MKDRKGFIVWMLGYPIVTSVSGWLDFQAGGYPPSHYSDSVLGIAAAMNLCIWFAIGASLWFSRSDDGR